MKISHTKSTKFARSPLCHLRALCVMLSLFAASAMAQEATQKPRIVCEHAAPPPGMRWVCKAPGFCDCHLEGKMKNDEDGVTPNPLDTSERRVCQYQSPEPGNLVVCDSACSCRVFGPKDPQNKEPEKTTVAGSCQQLIKSIVAPEYPPIARTNRIAGVVFIQIEIGEDGSVKNARAIEGHPMLTQAALGAVKRWNFDTSCNRVRMVDVRFRLSDNDETDPPGVIINPPDEVEVVGRAPEVDTTSSAVGKKNKKKKTSDRTPTSK